MTATKSSLEEAFRVLKAGGTIFEITFGDRDKENIARIFERGQNYGKKERTSSIKRKMLSDAGFAGIVIREYLATEIFESIDDLIIRMKSAPIIPDFDVKTDWNHLMEVEKICASQRGIETPKHRVTISAMK